MAQSRYFVVKIGADGRVVLPSEVRRALDITPGERALLVLEEGGLRMLPANAAAASLRAGNPAAEPARSVADDVREMRSEDTRLSCDKWARVAGASGEPARSDEDVLAELLTDLDLSQ